MQYEQLLIETEKTENEQATWYFHKAVGVMFTQMTEKDDIKHFGEVAIAKIIKEFKHLDEGEIPLKPVVVPMDPYLLTQD